MKCSKCPPAPQDTVTNMYALRFYTHAYVHAQSTRTHLFSRTPPHAEASSLAQLINPPLSVPAGWVQHISLLRLAHGWVLRFVCRPAGNGVRTPHSHPHTSPSPTSHTRLYHDLCYEVMNETTCRCHLCPYVFMCKRCMCSCVMSGVLKLHMGCDRVVTTNGTGYPHVNQCFYRFLNYYILPKG